VTTVTRAFTVSDSFRRVGTLVAVAAAVLLAGGCGGVSTPAKAPGPQVRSAAPAAVGVLLDVTGAEYSFAPSPLKASAGRTTIRFTNKGAVEHDFAIDALHVHLVAQPGKMAEATLTLKPGTYKSYCSVPGHRQSGMQGTLTVS